MNGPRPTSASVTSAGCLSETVLLDYLARTLPPDEMALVRAHADACTRCELALAMCAASADHLSVADSAEEAAVTRSLRLLPGRSLGRYRLERLIGRGGMGLVFEAHDDVLERRVALKLLASTTTKGHARALHEARSMARLTHPNVVPVYDVALVDDEVVVSMELVVGQTLAEWLRTHPAESSIIETMLGIARGISAAHGKGIIHRDLKPANVLIDTSGTPKVTDFGLAALLDDDVLAGPAPGLSTNVGSLGSRTTIAGTPAYMAPEVLDGSRGDGRVDQYALGICMYQALTGELPFPARTTEEARELPRDIPLRWPSQKGRELRGIVERLLAPTPDARYGSMNDVVLALIAARSERTRGARRRWGLAAGFGVAFASAGAVLMTRGSSTTSWSSAHLERASEDAAPSPLNEPTTAATTAPSPGSIVDEAELRASVSPDPGANAGSAAKMQDVMRAPTKTARAHTSATDERLEHGTAKASDAHVAPSAETIAAEDDAWLRSRR